MSDIAKILSFMRALWEFFRSTFGGEFPDWLATSLKILLVLGLALLAAWGLLHVVNQIRKLISEIFAPLMLSADDKRRRRKYQRFAGYLIAEIQRLNRQEEWRDYHFTELEAEVEVETKSRWLGFLGFWRIGGGIRRERSLSKALKRTTERLILLEGDPGSGKTVALRHVAQMMAEQAQKHGYSHPLPIYVNLRELQRDASQTIDKTLVKRFVSSTFDRINDRDVDEFLKEEFERGLASGTWFFLFDSFDELPEILSSTQADKTVGLYAQAIADFLQGMNQCRGVLASRHFRGPGQLGWPKFRILSLSENRRIDLARRSDLPRDDERLVISHLATADDDWRMIVSNPMFLGLLCDHVRSAHQLPESRHNLFEAYVQRRLDRDEQRLSQRFHVTTKQLRNAAEAVAFAMTSNSNIGLSPKRDVLHEAIPPALWRDSSSVNTMLDALEFMKLARPDTNEGGGDSKVFTFVHRRFQEYFATCAVLRNPQRVNSSQLLIDGRWRETVVVLCQIQPEQGLTPILNEALMLLQAMVSTMPKPDSGEPPPSGASGAAFFPWPDHAQHVLGILQEGFASRPKDLPENVREQAGFIVQAASDGTLLDKKWALEVASVAPAALLLRLVKEGFQTPGNLLREAAFRQAGRLGEASRDISNSIRTFLVNLDSQHRLRAERFTVFALLDRLEKPQALKRAAQLLLSRRLLDLAFHASLFAFLFIPTAQALANSSHGQFDLYDFGLKTALAGFLLLLSFSMDSWIRLLGFWPDESLFIHRGLVIAFMLSQVTTTFGFLPYFAIYVAIWAPLALISAQAGIFTHVVLWPLIPMSLVVIFGRFIFSRVLGVIRAAFGGNWKPLRKMLLGLGVFGGFIGFVFALFFLVKAIAAGNPLMEVLLLSPFIAFLGFGLLSLVKHWLVNWFLEMQDWRSLRRRTSQPSVSMDGIRFLSLWEQFKTIPFRARFARSIRQQGSLEATANTEAVLRDLLLGMEADLKQRQVKGQNVPLRYLPRSYLQALVAIPRLTTARGDPALLDEVCLLLEQVRAKRTGNPS